MADDTQRPSVLICGGLNTCSRALATFLVPVEGEPLVSFLRIVDKYSVHPATTYIGPDFKHILTKSEVEYRQANLTVAATVESAFNPPEGKPAFDYVFDFTGEVRNERSEAIQISNTFAIARLLGLEAAKRKVKAYVRIQHPFYETSSKHLATEKDDIKPADYMGVWWHETLRTLAAIPDLNLVVLRIGFMYGPFVDWGNIISAMTVASTYGYRGEPMKSLWSPGKHPMNTVHVDDIAGGAWACANWISKLGREEANRVAGVSILFHNEKAKIKDVEGVQPIDEKPIAPLFNLVDDSNSTLASTGTTVTALFGTTFEFFNIIEIGMIKINDRMEEINQEHVGSWVQMLQNSTPPISSTPLSVYLDKYALKKYVVGFDNSKIKQIVGYKLRRPVFNEENIKELVDKWKAEGLWPNV